MPDATITYGGEERSSGAAGNFTIDRLVPDDTVRIAVSAFGYLPARLTVMPSADTVLFFPIEVDSLAMRLIEAQVERLDERSSSLGYARSTIDRKELLSTLAATPRQLVEQALGLKHPTRPLRVHR